MASDISIRLGVDGERELRTAFQAIDEQVKSLNKQLGNAVSEFAGMESSEEAVAKKSGILNQSIDAQSQKIDLLKQQYGNAQTRLAELAAKLDDSKAKFGENSAEVAKAQNAYNRQTAEVAKLDGKLADAEKTLRETKNQLDNVGKAADGMGNDLSKAEASGGKLGNSLKSLFVGGAVVAGITAAAAAVKGLASGLKDAVMASAEYGDQVDKQSQKLQISAENYQKLAFAAERSGTSIETMATAQKTLAGKDFNGDLIDAINYVAGIADESERAAAATELFGKKAGMEMLPLLNSGTDGIKAMYEEVEMLGGVMSNEAVAASAAFEDTLTNFNTAMNGIKNSLAAEFLPAVSEVLTGFIDMIRGNAEQGQEEVRQGVEHVADTLTSLTERLIEMLPQMLEIGIMLLTQLIVGIVQNIPKLAAQAPAIVKALAEGIIYLLGSLFDVGADMVNAAADGAKSLARSFVDIGKNLVSGLWEGIKSRIAWLTDMVRGFCSDIVGAVTDAFDIHSPSRVFAKIGENLTAGMAQGYLRGGREMLGAVSAVNGEIMGNIGYTNVNAPQLNASKSLVESLVNGFNASTMQNLPNVTLRAQIVLPNGQILAETLFDDLLDVSKQRGVAFA